jgi:hypothetical protein
MKRTDDGVPTFYPVKDKDDLALLNGYQIENINESSGDAGSKATNIFLKRKLRSGRFAHRELMILADGKKFMTEEY